MKKIVILMMVTVLCSLAAEAHICNDVFLQAKDNLVVKVDVRDGQLRIKDTGTFRVYLLNTMDRDIVEIHLDVISTDFNSNVKPEENWQSYPQLRTSTKNGKKQFFEVTLTRKKKTTKGKYKISLLLYGKNKNQVFKTVDIDSALDNMEVPKAAKSLKIDGNAKSAEWKKGLLLTSFNEYKQSGRFMENFPASQQTRIRMFHDDDNLYLLVDLQKKSSDGSDDKVELFIARDQENQPETITVDFKEKKVSCSFESKDLESKTEEDGTKMEIKIPLKSFLKKENADGDKKSKEPESFWLNASRKAGNVTSFWRGNPSSVKNPVAFARIILK